jgi:replicative DNA helicase
MRQDEKAFVYRMEGRLLGQMMSATEGIGSVIEKAVEGDFIFPAHICLFRAVKAVRARGVVVTVGDVVSVLGHDIFNAGGALYIAQLGAQTSLTPAASLLRMLRVFKAVTAWLARHNDGVLIVMRNEN